MTALYASTVDADGTALQPVKVTGHDKVKVNIPEFAPGKHFQEDGTSVIRDTIDKIYNEGK